MAAAGGYTAPDMITDWESEDGDTVAELEAEQRLLATQLADLRRDEEAAALMPARSVAAAVVDDSARALAEENARLKQQLAAMVSASAHRSTVKRAREDEEAAALLKKYTAENEKLAAALATGSGLSKLTVARPTASVIAASHARSTSLVGTQLQYRNCFCGPYASRPQLAHHDCCVNCPDHQFACYKCRPAALPDPVSRQAACGLSSETLRPERKG